VAATPRRLIALVADVAPREEDRTVRVRGPKLGAPATAVEGFARAQGGEVGEGETHYFVERFEAGRPAGAVLSEMLAELVRELRSARNMRWNDPELSFTRPIRWLLALLGDDVVPVAVSTLAAGRVTHVLRDADEPVVTIASAESFMESIAVRGVVADPEDREQLIVTGAQDLVYPDGRVELAPALVQEVTYLVEAPNPLLGTFDESYLALPAEVLTTVMRKHQRYFPVRDESGALLPMFVTVANGTVDVEAVRAGNEAVLRARYEDASFFYRADRETPLPALRDRLSRITFTDKLGTMADRAARIAALATGWDSGFTLGRAAALVKVDLGSQMVTEMTGLAGVMARDYLLHAGEPRAVAQAVYECELPRAAGDDLPVSRPGAMLSLADRLDLLVGLAATVGLPTGSSDPFAVRRAALGLLAVLRAHPSLPGISAGLEQAAALQPVPAGPEVLAGIADFLTRRLEQQLVEEGNPVDRVRAVLVHADRPARVDFYLAQLASLAGDPAFRSAAASLDRARRIVPPGVPAAIDRALLTEPAEIALIAALTEMPPVGDWDLSALTATSGPIVAAVHRFFEEVLVMADDPALRAARLGLAATVRDLGAGLLDWDALRL
ncbi:glycine--tRNA ligase subunit beta, partial [Actinoplanes sp. NPDC051633]|uniref:glycine--tRNA ligase subunit beta n=1 Tax=Actinoplanes sp. NPDC051633 TaxID=3155670 RepID=UPI0034196E09